MLPSRCEHRLIMRHDNADERLCPIGRELGLLSDGQWDVFNKKRAEVDSARVRLASTKLPVSESVNSVLRELDSSPLFEPVAAIDLLKRPEISWRDLSRFMDVGMDEEACRRIEIDAKYEGYAEREKRRVRRLSSMELLRIPDGLVYSDITGLSAESAEKLSAIAPKTLGQASRVPGVNNVDIQLVQVAIEKNRREARN
jgi:tRNA uridine 5-carboxymethylaminomethyl modification enzyme